MQKPPILTHIGARLPKKREKGRHLSVEDKLVILWGLTNGWSVDRIATSLPAGYATVARYKSRVFEDPKVVFELPVVSTLGKHGYRCRLCGEERSKKVKVMRHVLAHVLPYEIARDIHLTGEEFGTL